MDRSKIDLDKPLKIAIIGDGGSGKTTFFHLISGAEQRTYLPTIGCDTSRVKVKLSQRNIEIVLWDTAGPEKFGILRRVYFEGAVGAIIFSDLLSRATMNNITHWIKDVEAVCGNIPLAICVNKVDKLPESKNISPKRFLRTMRLADKKNAMFCEMSVWAQFGVHEPLIWIIQQLTGKVSLTCHLAAIIPKHRQIMERDPYEVEDDDFDSEVPKIQWPAIIDDAQIARNQRKSLDDVIKSCSPRVKNVMEALLTGVRTRPAFAANNNPLQRPSLMFVEGLTCQEFHPIQTFDFVQPLLEFYRQHENDILLEAKRLMGTSDLDSITSSIQGSWKSFYFVESGQIDSKSHVSAPLMTQMIQLVPSLMTCSFGYAYMSILGPHSHITPHCGPCNIKLRCHLPLMVPSDECTIRVGSTTKQFKQGELLIFDDSIEHEVRNDSSSPRVILLFDIWHPDLTADEVDSFNTYFK